MSLTSRPAPAVGPGARPLVLRLGAFALIAASVGCAGRGVAPSTDGTPAASRSNASSTRPDTPPRIISSGRLQLRGPTIRVPAGSAPPPASTMPALDVHLRVTVGADGRPDMSTLFISGRHAPENRDALTMWVSSIAFVPALRDGVPVAGVFEWQAHR